jgi:hypothetical protein
MTVGSLRFAGSVPGQVVIGGVTYGSSRWSADSVRVRLPVSGPGSAGEVVVWSDGRRSTPRYLTDWRLTFNLSYHPEAEYKWEGPVRTHFRADVGHYRHSAGRPAKFRTVHVLFASDADGDLTASGQRVSGGTTTVGKERAIS